MPSLQPPRLALETTLLFHGVPRDAAVPLAEALDDVARSYGAVPALIGVFDGRPVVGLSTPQLEAMLAQSRVPKVNAANLGIAMHRRMHGATTVSATVELAAGAGIRVFSTGGLGGVHKGLAERMDISSDLVALARHPVAVVCSGVKSLLDIPSSREVLETLGVPVVGFGTHRFPAFYTRDGGVDVDDRFDDPDDLAAFVAQELERTRRGVVIANPPPAEHMVKRAELEGWLGEAEREAREAEIEGRDVTPFMLSRLHRISKGATLRANLALVSSNVALGARLAVALSARDDVEDLL